MSDPLLSAPYGNAHTAYRRGCFAQVVLTHSTTASIDTARSASGVTLLTQPGSGVYTFQLPQTGRGVVFTQLLSSTLSDCTVNSYVPTTGALSVTVRALNGTATDLADGNELWLLIELEGG